MFRSREVMTSLLEPSKDETYISSTDANHNLRHRHCRNVLRSKQNTYGHKCKKKLKNKLKKYKLRQDGKEDQDIIDVSQALVSSLVIRSPNKVKDFAVFELEELRPKNYLFRMGRKKQTTLTSTKSLKSLDTEKKTCEKNVALQMSPATEEKKQTNAFKVLMDSRNKSIGTNSPGKDMPCEETEVHEMIEKRSNKAKRHLILQKMAEEKGSSKKKEIEELHENHIKRKMEQRAEKLKTMIMNKEPKTVKQEKQKNHNVTSQKVRSPLDNIVPEKNGKVVVQLVSIFDNTCDTKKGPEKKIIPTEDEEFLKKLSPSLRKKESMLSYFKKVDKESDSADVDLENSNVIKVKFGVRPKKKGRKKKNCVNEDEPSSCEGLDIESVDVHIEAKCDESFEIQEGKIPIMISEKTVSDNRKGQRKRKREAKESTPCSDTPLSAYNSNSFDDLRPKRTVKRPVKYNNDAAISSSDEDLHIFTPKRKKHIDHKDNPKCKSIIDLTVVETVQEKAKQDKKPVMDKREKKCGKEKKSINTSKAVKLAPIFKKSQLDTVEIEAKQKFLQSGVPEQLKKLILKQKEHNTYVHYFPEVVHVQQLPITLQTPPALHLKDEICIGDISIAKSLGTISNMIDLTMLQSMVSMHLKNNASTQTMLQNIKDAHPRFPVHRTYKLLRGKKKGEFRANNNILLNLDNSVEMFNCSTDMQNDNPDQLTWCDKYKPLSGKEIIGNFENIKELKKWLVAWTENDRKVKATNANDSDSSDYYQSEPDSRDSMKSNNNLLILSGPLGSGKTSCVYAVAAELSMKVIEVNASSKRTGKIMLQDLQEATQSHKINRAAGSTENSQKSQEIVEPPKIEAKKRGRPKKVLEPASSKKLTPKPKPEVANCLSASQENTRTAMSLILIDDADIIFDQDDGFCSAIVQLVQSSKRPVVLITGSLSCPHLQRFLQSGKVLKMQPLLPNILGTWLDLMCLAECGSCWPGLGGKFLNFFKGDIRKTINCLQFYIGSQDQLLSVEGNSQINSQSNDVKFNGDDESSCISWADRDVLDDKNINHACNTVAHTIWENLMNEYLHIKHMKNSLRIFDVWWSLPKILNTVSNLNSGDQQVSNRKGNKNKLSLESMNYVLDSISVCDYLSYIRPETKCNMTSHPWYDAECNSVSEIENFDYYDSKYETNNELIFELVRGSIATAQEKMEFENSLILDIPGMSAKRKRDRIVSRHNSLTSYLSPQSSLDRKAVALDYWSSCRTICRIERSKTDSNSKRNNRFCHYLKSLNILCNSDTFDNLANSLNPSGPS